MHAEGRSQVFGTVFFAGDAYDFASDRHGLGSKTVPRIEGTLRMGERHRLTFNGVRYEEDSGASLGEDVSFGDSTFPAGSGAELETTFDLDTLVYDFGMIETPTSGAGLQIGGTTARLRGKLNAESGEERFSVDASERGTTPVVGARISAGTEDGRVCFVAQGQSLDVDWGDFGDCGGDLSRANALVEYRLTPRAGVFAGFDGFKLDVRRSRPRAPISSSGYTGR